MNLTPDHDPLELLSPTQVARLLGVAKETLATWRCYDRQPLAYVKVGRRVRYRRAAVEEYVHAHEKSGA